MRISLVTICIVFICCIGMATAEEPRARAGFVKNVSGQAFIERNKVRMSAKVKDRLMENDILVTGRNGSMGIILQDNSVMSIGSNTRLVISKFVFEPADKKLSFIAQIKKGKVVYLTGLIAKLNRSGVKFETPTVVCGIRGTHFAIEVEDPEN
ncbi:MAG: FecR domain-containing protein [Deltaproteobacteria bacterium]|nr:FecR domain-containing protein [Deltaproteobacteria bacterium]